MILYKHIRNDNGKPFYIGISNNLRRPFDKYNRPIEWKQIAGLGYTVKIAYKNLTKEQAQIMEIKLMERYRKTIVNKNKGNLNRVKPQTEEMYNRRLARD